jgi:hypothetical protein
MKVPKTPSFYNVQSKYSPNNLVQLGPSLSGFLDKSLGAKMAKKLGDRPHARGIIDAIIWRIL